MEQPPTALPASEIFDPSLGKQIVVGRSTIPLKRPNPLAPYGSAVMRFDVTFRRVK